MTRGPRPASADADDIHARLGVRRPINAAGTFTPLGVSRSPPAVGRAVAAALGGFFVVDELQALASRRLAAWSGAEAGTVVHCASAAITLSVAAAIAGDDPARIAALPATDGLADRVVLPATHAVDYGHPIEQDVRLAGGRVVLAGDADACDLEQLRIALEAPGVACLLLVSSRLVRGAPLALDRAVALGHRRGVPVVIDGAAQDRRVGALLATGADLVLFSGQKYLAAPTAGVVVGRAPLVKAVRMQEKGIGRAMKASKEAIVGLLAALDARAHEDPDAWRDAQAAKARRFADAVGRLPGLRATLEMDPAGMPFPRVRLQPEPALAGVDAATLAQRLQDGSPPIHVMRHALASGALVVELVGLRDDEVAAIADALGALLDRRDAAAAPPPPE
ncbi:MAG: aminotransferase class V-fold PLP-dependent enzyme [Lautropia sp.]